MLFVPTRLVRENSSNSPLHVWSIVAPRGAVTQLGQHLRVRNPSCASDYEQARRWAECPRPNIGRNPQAPCHLVT